MTQVWEQQFIHLQQRLHQLHLGQIPFPVVTELCFRQAEKELLELMASLRKGHFSDMEEEVWMYKVVLPKFIAEKEYYQLVNYANRFCPDHPREQAKFWITQQERVAKFKAKHADFVSYEQAGWSQLDSVYYSREEVHGFPTIKGQFMARERFAAWAAEKLKMLA